MTPRPLRLLLLALALTAAACASYTVEGDFAGRPLNGHAEPALTIVLIHNHGFSRAQAGTYRPATPPILRFAADRNPDVVAEWDGFATRTAGRAPWLRIVRVSRPRVLELCDFCGRDSHGAYWDGRFAAAFFDDHVQTLIDGIRARIRARLAASAH